MSIQSFTRITRRTAIIGLFGVVALATSNLGIAQAQALETIKARGKLIVGIQGSNPPFGFLDSAGKNDGYDADISKLFAEKLGVPVEYVSMMSQDRIPALQTGKVDILFATLAMTAERAKSIQYSIPYAANEATVVAAKTTNVKGPDDLKSVALGVQKASSQENELKKLAPDSNILRFDDDSTTIQALLSGQVEAIGANQFYINRLEGLKPGIYENKFRLAVTYNGVGTKLGDKELNAVVNSFLEELKSSGKLAELYQKWMKLPLPEFPDSVPGVTFVAQ